MGTDFFKCIIFYYIKIGMHFRYGVYDILCEVYALLNDGTSAWTWPALAPFIYIFLSANNFRKKARTVPSPPTKSRNQEGKAFKFPTSLFLWETNLRRWYTFSGGFFLAEGDLTETEVGEEIFLDEELLRSEKNISTFDFETKGIFIYTLGRRGSGTVSCSSSSRPSICCCLNSKLRSGKNIILQRLRTSSNYKVFSYVCI